MPSFVEMTSINQPLIEYTDQNYSGDTEESCKTYEVLFPFLKLVLVSFFFFLLFNRDTVFRKVTLSSVNEYISRGIKLIFLLA